MARKYRPTRSFTPGGGRYSLAGSSASYPKIGKLKITIASNSRSISGAFENATKYAEQIPEEALSEVSEYRLALARKFSSGTITKAKLRTYRPGKYSVRRSNQKRDYIVNAHVGRFRDAWKSRPVQRRGKVFTTGLYNAAMPVAAFLLLGTRIMRERPLLREVSVQSRRFARDVVNKLAERVRYHLKKGRRKMRKHG